MASQNSATKSNSAWLRRYFDTSSPAGLRRTLLYLGAIICLLLFGVLLAEVRHTLHGILFDARIQSYVYAHRSHALTLFFTHVSELASVTATLLLLVVSSVLLYRSKHGKLVPLLVLSVAVDGVVIEVLKTLVARHRPAANLALVHETSFSFPSGHTMAAVLCWGVIAYILARACTQRWQRRMAAGIYAFGVALVASSRVYLGAHYPTDVIGSILVGAALLGIMLAWLTDHPKQLPNELFSLNLPQIFGWSIGIVVLATLIAPRLFT